MLNCKIYTVTILIINYLNFSSMASESAMSLLEKDVSSIKSLIQQAHKKADVDFLKQIHAQSLDLQYDQEVWHAVALKQNNYIFKDQTARDSVIGDLFYMYDVDEHVMNSYKDHLLYRNDILWSFIIASYHKNPLAEYFMTWLV